EEEFHGWFPLRTAVSHPADGPAIGQPRMPDLELALAFHPHPILPAANSGNDDFHLVACPERPHPGRGSGSNDVPWFERHHSRDVTDYRINRGNHVGHAAKLLPLAVDERFHR